MNIMSRTTLVGVGFCDLLAVLFVALKLTGVIAWSWWWVLAPIWIPAVILAVILALILAWIVGVKV